MTHIIWSEESKLKMVQTRRKNNSYKHSEKSKLKMSLSKKGSIPWNTGLTTNIDTRVALGIEKMRIANLGKPLSEEHKQKIRDNAKINPNFGNKGRKFSEITIEKLRKSHMGKIFPEEQRIKMRKSIVKSHSRPEVKLKLRLARSKQIFPFKDTKIEVKTQELLSLLHIEYIAHKYMSEITHSYQCDIFIPEQKGISQKTIIECDGCFFHACPICKMKCYEWTVKRRKLDKLRTKELIEKGFRVIRLWEHEIKVMNVEDLQNKLIEVKK